MPPKNRPEDLLDWLGLKSSPDWGVAKPLGRFSGFIVSLAILIIPLLVLGALIAAGVVLYDTIHNVFFPPASGSSPNLGAGALIAALLGAPFVIWGTYIKYQSLGFQREGHITDRISKAVEQLGAEKTVKREGKEYTEPNIEVRIGGLLSIERIAQDSVTYDKGRDHVRMMEILCAYVRNNAPASDLEPTSPPFQIKRPRIDIQKAMDVIKSRSDAQIQIEAATRYRLDLRDCELDGCDLSNARLQGANLARSRFECAEFRSADLSGARMHECLLNYANFTNCRLIGTFWHGAIYNGSRSFDIGLWHSDLAIWIEATDVTAVRFNPKNEGKFFGSRDTIVDASYRDDQAVALDLAIDISLQHLSSPEEVAVMEDKIAALSPTAKQFISWNPYSAGDMAAFGFRDKFIEKHNLKGWPHDDTPPS